MKNKVYHFSLFSMFVALTFLRCNMAPTTFAETGRLSIEVNFRDTPSAEAMSKTSGRTGATGTKVKITKISARILDADSTEVVQEDLVLQPDSSFAGNLTVPVGKNRIIELTALYDTTVIATGDTAGIDIVPGRTTAVGLELVFANGLARNLQLLPESILSGVVGEILQKPIRVKVTDVGGVGVPAVGVLFKVTRGKAFFAPKYDSLLITNSQGIAQTNFFLGEKPEKLQISISANDLTGDALIDSPIIIAVTAKAPLPLINAFTPILATAGTQVLIRGEYFNYPPVSVSVGRNDVSQNFVTILADTLLRLILPEGMGSGPLAVQTAGGTAKTGRDLSVIRSENIEVNGALTGIASSLDGASIYVGDAKNIRLLVLSTRTYEEIRSISLFDSTSGNSFSFPGAVVASRIPRHGEFVYAATTRGVGLKKRSTQTNGKVSGLFFEPNDTAHDIVMSENGLTGYISSNQLIHVFTTIQLSPVATITEVSVPIGMAINQNESRLYVANSKTNDVRVFDTENNNFIESVDVGNVPRRIAMSSVNNRFYVTNQLDNTVSVISEEPLRVISTIAVGPSPDGIAITPDNAFVFVANTGGKTVSVIDVGTNSIVAMLPAGQNPTNIAITPLEEKVFVTNTGSVTIYSFE